MSMIEVAYKIVSDSKEPLPFQKLWQMVAEEQEFDQKQIEDNISRFYSQLGSDGRFVMLEENFWDLKERHPYDKSHIDMNEIYLAEDDEEDEEETEKTTDSEEEGKESLEDEDFNESFEEEEDVPFGFEPIDEEDEY